jgi:hypothetical protein
MPNELSTLAGRLIAQAAKALPKTTGETDTFARRFAGASDTTVIVCDVSGSMADAAGGRRKIDHLRDALQQISGPNVRLIRFDSVATEIASAAAIGEPSGGTAMHLGLDAAARHRPRKTVVISDGLPDSETEALAAAERLSGIVDVIFCGPDSDTAALAFMRRLARAGAGNVVSGDFRRGTAALANVHRGRLLLTGPKS